MGMTLEESVEGLLKLESNGVEAYIDSGLNTWIEQRGNIYVDFVSEAGNVGFTVAIKRSADEKPKCC